MEYMPRDLEPKVSPLELVLFFSIQTILIRALLCISNTNSFVRKLLDSENSHMTEHMVF